MPTEVTIKYEADGQEGAVTYLRPSFEECAEKHGRHVAESIWNAAYDARVRNVAKAAHKKDPSTVAAKVDAYVPGQRQTDGLSQKALLAKLREAGPEKVRELMEQLGIA